MSTLVTCAVALALVAVTAVVVMLAAALTARQRAGGAADLAALAAAGRALSGSAIACAAAQEVTEANGVQLESCRLDGLLVRVTTSARVHVGPLDGSATGRALAGPVGEGVE